MKNLELSMMQAQQISLETTSPFLIRWAKDAVFYYINSGRAYTDWVKAYAEADQRKLLYYMIGGRDHSDQAMIKRATSYLKQHHHLA